MEKYIFIPINSLNLNNVLSSESISPSSFYEKRGYGFKRFEKITINPFVNSFLAFNKLPLIEDTKSDREEYPIYIAVPLKLISDISEKFESNEILIYQIDRTIYLNWFECFFISRNPEEKNKLIASTKRSLEVKHSEFYLKNFCSIKEMNFEVFNWNDKIINAVNDKKNINIEYLFEDQKLNKIKGFLYGYMSGKLNEQSEELSRGKLYFQEFINSFSGLMNELSLLISDNKFITAASRKKQLNSEINNLIDLKERISILFGSTEYDKINEALKNDFKLSDNDFNYLKKFNYKNTKTSITSILIDFLKQKQPDFLTIEELLEQLISKAKHFINYNSSRIYNELEGNFNEARILINGKIIEFNKITNSNQFIETIPVIINENYSKIKLHFDELNNLENQYLQTIVNELLSRTELSTSDEIAQQRKDIIVSIAKSLENLNEKFKDSAERKYLLRLHESLKTVGVGFKLIESDNIALQSIACFLNRYSEIEKINDFMMKNNFIHYGIVFGNWGAAYGYANLSKILIEPLHRNSKALKLLVQFIYNLTYKSELDYQLLDSYLNSKAKNDEQTFTMQWDLTKEKNILEEPNSEPYIKTPFIDLITENKKLNTNDEWIEEINYCFKEVSKEINSGELFDNENAKVSLFSDLLTEKAKKMDKFGKAKIDIVILIYREFLQNV